MLLLQRTGTFHLRSAQHQLVVDPTVSVIARAGEPAEIAHPHGRGDLATYVVVSSEVFEALAWPGSPVSGLAPVTGHVVRLHERLLRLHAPLDGWMAVEDAAIRLFVAALSGADTRRPEPQSLGARRQEQIVDDTRGVLAADPTIDSLVLLSRMVGCSPHHLSRLFHRRIGKTLVQHRLELRVHQALERLRDHDTTLAEVAADTGFADHAHLTRSFRRFLGVTPSELRGLRGLRQC
jgi:AraC-like DNA-binding protein